MKDLLKGLYLKNKKAQVGYGVTWVYKFLILTIVVGIIVAVITTHYSGQYDIRNIEASIISEKLVNCIAPNGIVSDEIIKEFNNTIKNCLPLDKKENYINISLDNKSIIFGDSFLQELCQLKENKKNKVKIKYYPFCLKEKYYVLKGTEPSQLNIFIAIKKVEKNL